MPEFDLGILSSNLAATNDKVKISKVIGPTDDSDAANKEYVDERVVANPGGDDGATLSRLQIGDDNYIISGGGGGGNNPPAHVSVDVAFDTSAVVIGDAVNRTATVTVTAGTFENITNDHSSQGSTTVSNNTVVLDVTAAAAGTLRLSFDVTYEDTSSTSYTHTENFSITVKNNWYAGLTNDEPSSVGDLTNQGAFVQGDQVVFDNSGQTQEMNAYAFIPTEDTDTAVITTTRGFEIPFTKPGVTAGDHTLILLGSVDGGDSNTLEVGEV